MPFIQLGCGVDVKLCLSRAEQSLITALKPLILAPVSIVDSNTKIGFPQNQFGTISHSTFGMGLKQNNELEIL